MTVLGTARRLIHATLSQTTRKGISGWLCRPIIVKLVSKSFRGWSRRRRRRRRRRHGPFIPSGIRREGCTLNWVQLSVEARTDRADTFGSHKLADAEDRQRTGHALAYNGGDWHKKQTAGPLLKHTRNRCIFATLTSSKNITLIPLWRTLMRHRRRHHPCSKMVRQSQSFCQLSTSAARGIASHSRARLSRLETNPSHFLSSARGN